MTEQKNAIESVVKAWDELPGNKYYSLREIQRWLIQEMAPAISKCRDSLGTGE